MVVFYRPGITNFEKADKKPNEEPEIKIVKPIKLIKNVGKKRTNIKPNEVADIKIAKSVNKTIGKYRKKADKKPNEKIYITEILRYLQTSEYITNKTARELLNLADSTIKRIFKKLVDDNLVVSQGERGQRKYALKREPLN